jgi:hypothetical protein
LGVLLGYFSGTYGTYVGKQCGFGVLSPVTDLASTKTAGVSTWWQSANEDLTRQRGGRVVRFVHPAACQFTSDILYGKRLRGDRKTEIPNKPAVSCMLVGIIILEGP